MKTETMETTAILLVEVEPNLHIYFNQLPDD